MDKRTEISNALKDAMKSKDTVALSTIRLILAAMKDRDIAARGTGNAAGITDTEILSMMQTMIKQRVESSDIYTKANRPELAAQELAEIEVIKRFLPQQMSEAEVRAKVDEIISALGVADIKDMG
ncbi:MAG: GatB/YqeY domain-containing protein, partial [Alphaproteobacteria bacterium]|nr:GatB/YqeY domain-containing protein [Alphaproteobacteria bacterium]